MEWKICIIIYVWGNIIYCIVVGVVKGVIIISLWVFTVGQSDWSEIDQDFYSDDEELSIYFGEDVSKSSCQEWEKTKNYDDYSSSNNFCKTVISQQSVEVTSSAEAAPLSDRPRLQNSEQKRQLQSSLSVLEQI